MDRKQGKLPELATDPVEVLCCQVCHREAKSQLQLVVHMALDHTKTECPFHCIKPGCSFVTEHKGDLRLHLKVSHNVTESMFGMYKHLFIVPQNKYIINKNIGFQILQLISPLSFVLYATTKLAVISI